LLATARAAAEHHFCASGILGDVAIIHAPTSYVTAGGERRTRRYTDVRARRDGRWFAVSAHMTR
jgi:hypothetical protein